jgi:putative ABC transport system substrate-binding protein
MRRRDFLTLLGSVATWPLTASAQQTAVPVIGFLQSTTASVFDNDRRLAFSQGLNEVGFAVGHNVVIEFRFANFQNDQLPALAADLVHLGVAAIVVNGVSLSAAMAATSTIPIVVVGGVDPVAQGLVSTLDRPSGNVTGISFVSPMLASKRLQLLNELLPKPTVIAVLLDSKGPAFEAQLQNLDLAAHTLGRRTVVVKATSASELETAFTTILQSAAGALFVGSSALFVGLRRDLVTFAASHGLPASYEGREFVELGGLMSYGASARDAYRRCGTYVGRILKGATPHELPIELSAKLDLVINIATAKALGLNMPRHLLAQATDVIE